MREQDAPACAPTVRHVDLDVTLEDDWARAIDAVVSECGSLYGLVNNAGVLDPPVEFTNVSLEQWRRQRAVNLDGPFIGSRFGMRAMARTGGGAIVNVSSGAAHITVPDAAAYCVSKSALLALTRLAAKAGGRHRIRVNAVLPGAIDTPMLWRNLTSGVEPAAFLENIARLHPIGRIGTSRDVATAVAFLLDPGNGFISGAMLAVDGGQLVA
jgi:NAD(P)-dependent dehydrogenase (short-subunit alcohol dehydrogenase family)